MMDLHIPKSLLLRNSIVLVFLCCVNFTNAQIRENSYFSLQVNGGMTFLSKKYVPPPCSLQNGDCLNKYYKIKSRQIANITGLYNIKVKENSPFTYYTGIDFYIERGNTGIATEWQHEFDSLYPDPKTDSFITWRKYLAFPIGVQYEIIPELRLQLNLTGHFWEWYRRISYFNESKFGDYKESYDGKYYHLNFGAEYIMNKRHGLNLRMQAPIKFHKGYKNYLWSFQIGYRYLFVKT